MNQDELKNISDILINHLFSEKIKPEMMLNDFLNLLPDSGMEERIRSIWEAKNESRISEGKNPIDLNIFMKLPGSNDKQSHTGKVKKISIEEKLIKYNSIFRNKLDDIDFNNLDVFMETELIDRLSNECQELSYYEVVMFYNLFKMEKISRMYKSGERFTDLSLTAKELSGKILSLIEEELFLTTDNLFKLNGNKTVSNDMIHRVMEKKIIKKRNDPYVLLLLLGEKNKKLVEKTRSFIDNFAEIRGYDPVEALNYLGLYFIIENSDDQILNHMKFSEHLENFIKGNCEGMALECRLISVYIHSFMMEIAAIIYNVGNKYKVSTPDMKKNLERLYNADRLRKHTDYIHRDALKKILPVCDNPQLVSYINKFKSTNRYILRTSDLFEKKFIDSESK